MPLRGIIVEGQALDWEDVPPEVMLPEIVRALQPDPNRHEDAIHLASLGVCPHRVKMERTRDYYLPPEAAYRLVRGRSWDCLINDYARAGAIVHRRFWRDFKGVPITGEPDLIDLKLRTIEDYKAPAKDTARVWPSYSFQLNGYAWITEEALREEYGLQIESLWLNVCGPTRYLRLEVPLWSPRTREVEVGRRLDSLLRVLDSPEVGPCGDPDCIFCRQETYWI